MTDSVVGSQISLISLREVKNGDQNDSNSSPQQKYDKSGVRDKSRSVRHWLKGRRKRKIGNAEFQTNSNSINHTVQEVHVQESNGKANGVSLQSNIMPNKKEDQNESRQFRWDNIRLLRWMKSVFQRKEKKNNIDINRSNKEKFKYFGFVIPALVFQPSAGRTGNTPVFADNAKLELTAAHIDDAIHGRGKFGKARAFLKSKTVQRCYKIISSRYWEYFLYFFIAVHSLLLIWEQSPSPVSIGQSWNGWEMNVGVLVMDAVCITVYGIDIALHIVFLSWRHFWKAKENLSIRVEFIFTLLFFIDFIILVLEKVLDRRLLPPFRCFRAAMLVCKSQNVAHIFKVLLSIMTRLGKVFAIIFIFILTFASIGLHLYMDDYHFIPETCVNATTSWNCSNVYSGAFDHVAIASLHMFVLMSTENYPDIIIPAYDVSWVNFFYFMFYLYAGVFFLTAILLAIIVESYWEYSKKHVKMERLRQREELVKAWNLLDQEGSGFLSVDDPKLLKLFRILRPKNSDAENQDLIRYINSYNQDLIIDSFDWTTRVVETLSIEFEPEEDENPDLKRNNRCHSGKIQIIFHRIIHAQCIGPAILVMILLHSVLFALMWSGITKDTQLGLQILRTSIIFIFLIEVILRIISDGSLLLNILDLLDIFMVIVAITGNVVWYILWFEEPRALSIYLGASIVASSLAVLSRLLFNSEQARSAAHILRNIYPVMFDLILLVITIIFFYAVIGLEIFQDQSTEKSQLNGFKGSYMQYGCGVGFDTFGCALLIVFQIVTTNDWHQIMLGAMTDTGWASSLYFLSCYLIINMIVMNLFVAISIEAYKKLARDGRDLATQPAESPTDQESTDAENPTEENDEENENNKKESIKNMAKSTFTGLFASSRTNRSSSLNNASSTGPTPYMGRRGTRGSIGTVSIPRTPKLDPDSSDDDFTIISRRSIPGTPMRRRRRTVSNASTSEDVQKKRMIAISSEQMRQTNQDSLSHAAPDHAYDKRQGAMKMRSDKRRKERRALKQQQDAPPKEKRRRDNILQVPQPKLSISDIVRLKKTVQIFQHYNAKDNIEMSVREGQIIAVTEADDEMYHGPNGWFPKTHASEVASLDDLKKNSPNTQRKTADGKNVNFAIENENDAVDKHRNSALTPAPGHPSLQHRHSQVRIREDWRKKIHGDMTVMNKDEMQELNRQLKGGLRHGRARVNAAYRIQNIPIRRVEEIIEENDEMPEVPQVTVSEAPQISSVDGNRTSSPSQNTNTLTLTVPETSKGKRQKPTGVSDMEKKGEMPEWMKNFAAEKGLEVEVHKFDESTLPSGSSDDEDQKIQRILVHHSDTNTDDSSIEYLPFDKDKPKMPIDKAAAKNENMDNAEKESTKKVTIPRKSSSQKSNQNNR